MMPNQTWHSYIREATERTKDDVVRFFCCTMHEVCGGGGKSINFPVLAEVIAIDEWYHGILRRDAFNNLSIPDADRVLLSEKKIIRSELKSYNYWANELKRTKRIPPLILKLPDSGDPEGASFGILDGSSRVQTYRCFIDDGEQDFYLETFVGIKHN